MGMRAPASRLGRVERQAEAGKAMPTAAGRAESTRWAGPQAGSWRGGWEDDQGRRGATAGLGPQLCCRTGRSRPQPIPTPTPWPRSENETGDQALSRAKPSTVGRGSQPLPPRAGARLTRAVDRGRRSGP